MAVAEAPPMTESAIASKREGGKNSFSNGATKRQGCVASVISSLNAYMQPVMQTMNTTIPENNPSHK